MIRCGPNRATSRSASREPIKPPIQGAPNASVYCHGANLSGPEHQHGELRLGPEDQAADQEPVEEHRAQRRAAEDVTPSVEQLASREPRGRRPRRARLVLADRGDSRRRQQVADRVGDHGRHRTEDPDGGTAERRADYQGGPGRRFEPAVGDEQVLRLHQGLEVRTARRVERDLGRGHHDRDDKELGEAEPAERVRRRDRHQRGKPGEIHRHHHRPLAPELHPRAERHRDHGTDREPRRREGGHLERPRRAAL